MERVRTIQPRVAFFWLTFPISWVNAVCALRWLPDPAEAGKVSLMSPMWGVLERRVATSPAVLHRFLFSLLALTLVRLNHKYWDIRLGGSCPWKHIT